MYTVHNVLVMLTTIVSLRRICLRHQRSYRQLKRGLQPSSQNNAADIIITAINKL